MSTLIDFLNEQAGLWIEIHKKIATSTVSKSGVRGTFTASIKEDSSLLKNIRTEVSEKDEVQYVRIYAPEHYVYANEGRKAGKMPPISAIRAWVIKKGLADNEKQETSIAWAIAMTIARKGSAQPAYHWLEKTAGAFEPKFLANTKAAASALFFEQAKKVLKNAANAD